MPNRIAAWLPALAYMALIWVLSSFPLLLPVGPVPFHDKGLHFVEYGVLGVLSARAMLKSRYPISERAALLIALLVTAVWGLVDEIHQAFVPNRHADWRDVLADWIGALLGVALVRLLHRRRAAEG